MSDARETRMIERDNCVLVMTPFSVDIMVMLSKRFKKGVMDSGVAHLADAYLAAGQEKDLKALREKLIAEKRAGHEARYANSGLSPEAVEWLLSGEQGTSSCSIFWKTTGVKPDYLRRGGPFEPVAHPADPDDLNRCILLLKAVPQCAANFEAMLGVSPEWTALVNNWRELVTTFQDEVGIDRTKGKRAPLTYDLMQKIFSSAKPSTI